MCLSLSTSYWPLVWPAPSPARLSVHEAGSSLTLPVRPAAAPDDVPLAPFGRPGWDVRVETRTILTSDGTDFHVDATLDGYEDGRRVFSRTWNESVPRVNV